MCMLATVDFKKILKILVAVIREVLANGFAHAVYNGRTKHEICIHPGMITIYSPGEYANNHLPEEYIKKIASLKVFFKTVTYRYSE